MGVLVFGTLHTNSASKTIDRVIDVFPTDQQRQVRSMLASSLAAVASHLLLRTADGKGRVAALELLLRTTGLANVIREGNTPMMTRNASRNSRRWGRRLPARAFAAGIHRRVLDTRSPCAEMTKQTMEPKPESERPNEAWQDTHSGADSANG